MFNTQSGLFKTAVAGIASIALFLCLHNGHAGAAAQVNVTTYHNDNGRTGQNLNETILTPNNVNQTAFGKLFSIPVDGYVYAQPLYLSNLTIPDQGTHNVVYIATEHDSVYAFDADSGATLWQTSFLNAKLGITTVPDQDVGCKLIVPELGISSTPVIDSTTDTIYVEAFTLEKGLYVQRLHALSATTGLEVTGSPVEIKASVKGTGAGSKDGQVTFNPRMELQRSALLLQNGMVEIAWASHCDDVPFHGWVMAYNEQTLRQEGVWNTGPNGDDGGVWMAGAGLAGDADFNTFVAVANGTFDASQGGLDYGDSIVKLLPAGRDHVGDYFTPYDQNTLRERDLDLGSGGLLLLPDQTQGPYEHLLVQAGKEGSIYLVNRDNMGGYNPENNNQIVQFIKQVTGSIYGMPAWWNNRVYFSGSYAPMKSFAFNTATGQFSTSPASETTLEFRYPGATPAISANGNTDAILWAVDSRGFEKQLPEVLIAYQANNLKKLLYASKQNENRDDPGPAVKYVVPTIVNGKVYLGAEYQVSVYGLLQ